MNARSPRRCASLAALLLGLAAPAVAQAPDPGLPRVLYGTPQPQVLYGNPSMPDPDSAPRRAPPPPAPAAPQQPQSSLSFQSGPAYLPPQAYWGSPPGYWGAPPPPAWGGQPGWDGRQRPVRPPPPNPPRYVSPEGGRFEPPLPQGRYVGRPPSAPPEPPVYGRPRGF